MSATVVELLGQEWCYLPQGAHPFEHISIRCNDDRYIVLCRVEKDAYTGEIRRVMVRPEDIKYADE